MTRNRMTFVALICLAACGRIELEGADGGSGGTSGTGDDDSGSPNVYATSDGGSFVPLVDGGLSSSDDAGVAHSSDGGRSSFDAGSKTGGLDSGSDGSSGFDSGIDCETPDDCSAELGPIFGRCITCPDGSEGCSHYVCLSGVCQTTYCPASATPPNECETANDCATLLGPLPQDCIIGCPPDGHTGCEHYLCLSGICQTSYCN